MRQVLVMMMMGFGVFTIPAMAAVNFTATDAGNSKLQIAYTTTDGDLPRGVALRISLSDGAVVDLAATAAAKSWDPAFNAFPDYAYSYPLGYQVGDGHPLASPNEAGVLTADASDFSISMEVLDQTGQAMAGPASSANLITIQLNKEDTRKTTVRIFGDNLRGPASGVVGDGVLTSNLPITVQMGNDCGLGCLRCTAPEYPDWVAWGKPVCWCYPYQCRGDIDGRSALGKRVTLADLNLFKRAFNQSEMWIKLVPNGICADFNHRSSLGKRVTLADLNEFKKYFNVAESSIPPCDMSNFNFWISP
jgi:hypothetical protein